ncbi:MAG: flagellar hook-length control protein FliK [Bdellovibrionota bacterium]
MAGAASLDLTAYTSILRASAEPGTATLDLRPGDVVWADVVPPTQDKKGGLLIDGRLLAADLPEEARDAARLKLQVVASESGEKAFKILQVERPETAASKNADVETRRAFEEILRALGTDSGELELLKSALAANSPSDLFTRIETRSAALTELLTSLVPLSSENQIDAAQISKALSATPATTPQLLLRVLSEAIGGTSELSLPHISSRSPEARLAALLDIVTSEGPGAVPVRQPLAELVSTHLDSLQGQESSLRRLFTVSSGDTAILPSMAQTIERTLAQTQGDHAALLKFVKDFGRDLTALLKQDAPDQVIAKKLEQSSGELRQLLERTPKLPDTLRVQLTAFAVLLDEAAKQSATPATAPDPTQGTVGIERLVQTLRDLGVGDVATSAQLADQLTQLTRAQIDSLRGNEPSIEQLVRPADQPTPVESVLRFVRSLEQRLSLSGAGQTQQLLATVDDIRETLLRAESAPARPDQIQEALAHSLDQLERAFPKLQDGTPTASASDDNEAERLARLLYYRLDTSLEQLRAGPGSAAPQPGIDGPNTILREVLKAASELEQSLEKTVALEEQVLEVVRNLGERLDDPGIHSDPARTAQVVKEALKTLRDVVGGRASSTGDQIEKLLPKSYLQGVRALEGQLLAALTESTQSVNADSHVGGAGGGSVVDSLTSSLRATAEKLLVKLSAEAPERVGVSRSPLEAQLSAFLEAVGPTDSSTAARDSFLVALRGLRDGLKNAELPSEIPADRRGQEISQDLKDLSTRLDALIALESNGEQELSSSSVGTNRAGVGLGLSSLQLRELSTLIDNLQVVGDKLAGSPNPVLSKLAVALREAAQSITAAGDDAEAITANLRELLTSIQTLTGENGEARPLPAGSVVPFPGDLEKLLKLATAEVRSLLDEQSAQRFGIGFRYLAGAFDLLTPPQRTATEAAVPQKSVVSAESAGGDELRGASQTEPLESRIAQLTQRGIIREQNVPESLPRIDGSARARLEPGNELPTFSAREPSSPIATPREVKEFTEVKQQLSELLASLKKPVGTPLKNPAEAFTRPPEQQASAQTRSQLFPELLADESLPELLQVLRKIDERSSGSASRAEQRIFALAREISRGLETGTFRKDGSEAETALQRSVTKLQDLLAFAVERNRANDSSAVFKEALQGLENIIRGQDVLKQLNPMFQALGEPAFILFPHLIQGMLSKVELTYYPAEGKSGHPTTAETESDDAAEQRIDPDGKRGGKERQRGRFDRVKLQLTLPALGDVAVDFAHTLSEMILTFTTSDKAAGDFLEENLSSLQEAFRALGYRSITLRSLPGPVTVVRPAWVEQVLDSRTIKA